MLRVRILQLLDFYMMPISHESQHYTKEHHYFTVHIHIFMILFTILCLGDGNERMVNGPNRH